MPWHFPVYIEPSALLLLIITNRNKLREYILFFPSYRQTDSTVTFHLREVVPFHTTIENEEKRQEILKQKEILIAGIATKVVKYLEVSPTTQYTSCQKFGYIGDRCSTRACRFYVAVYLSKDYTYPTCIITGKPYKHTTSLYINCKEEHFANSKDYKTLKVAKLVYT